MPVIMRFFFNLASKGNRVKLNRYVIYFVPANTDSFSTDVWASSHA